MKFTQELRTYLDARLAVFVFATTVLGFGVAHWNGTRAAQSASEDIFATLAYDVAFSQAAWIVILVLIAVAFIGSLFKGLWSYEGKRLAIQLMFANLFFALCNLALLAFRAAAS